jgi:hypothetical protein
MALRAGADGSAPQRGPTAGRNTKIVEERDARAPAGSLATAV